MEHPIKVLVLGASGMLGSMAFEYFKRQVGYEVYGIIRDLSLVPAPNQERMFLFDAERDNVDSANFWEFEPHYIINAIGMTKPYCKDTNMPGVRRAIVLNALFPFLLASACEKRGAKVIQIATDCVFSGQQGLYTEAHPHDALDAYGKTKSLGEVLSKNMLHLRTSVVGPERKGRLNLLEWFLAQPDGIPLKGFSHHRWNGITTLQFAQVCHHIFIKNSFDSLRQLSHVIHYTPNTAATKYELLKIFCRVYQKNHLIEEVKSQGPAVDRTLQTNFPGLINGIHLSHPMENAIAELYSYTGTIKFYQP